MHCLDQREPRTVLVSGASRGIGRAVAIRLLAEGHRLSLGMRQPIPVEDWLAGADAEAWITTNQGSNAAERVLIHAYDAQAGDDETNGAPAWVNETEHRWSGIDAVVHCAGLFSRVGLNYAAAEEREIVTLMDVNLMGPWRLSRAVWPHLVASGDGRVITVVSMSGKRVKGNLAAYSASKFALLALCQTMRNQGWDARIRVTAVCPSWVNTEMAAAVKALPKAAMTQPEDLAASIAHLLSLPRSAVPFEFNVSCQLDI